MNVPPTLAVMLIRPATEADLPGVLEIHAAAVATSTAIWTDVPPTLEGRADWLAAHSEPGRIAIVAVEGDTEEVVVGYGSYGPFHAKDGYRHTVENSVYVREGHQGAGIGRALMEELIARAADDGHHVMVALIEASNEASVRLHRSLGFDDAGVLREVGTKFGELARPAVHDAPPGLTRARRDRRGAGTTTGAASEETTPVVGGAVGSASVEPSCPVSPGVSSRPSMAGSGDTTST